MVVVGVVDGEVWVIAALLTGRYVVRERECFSLLMCSVFDPGSWGKSEARPQTSACGSLLSIKSFVKGTIQSESMLPKYIESDSDLSSGSS